ncbi:MAG: hypothetical protein ACI9KE_001252 [Polyangiales bacterium]|jgi:uncharacterized protein (DUF1330 family)
MSTHVIVRHEVTNEEAYAQYRTLAGPSVKLHGGSLVTKGTTHEHLEGGDHLDHFVVLAFPSPEAAGAWFRSPEYIAARNARAGAGEMTLTIISS